MQKAVGKDPISIKTLFSYHSGEDNPNLKYACFCNRLDLQSLCTIYTDGALAMMGNT